MTVTRYAPNRLTVHLIWKATAPPTRDYTVFVHLLGPDGTVVAQHDGPPDMGRWPTTWWAPGQVISDTQALGGGDDVVTSGAIIEVGLYNAGTGIRLQTYDTRAGENLGTALRRNLHQ